MASNAVNPFLASIEDGLTDITNSRYTMAAGLAILIYDWLLTLGTEVQLIWPARRSIVKTIFLINRYCSPVVLVWANYAWSGNALWFKPLSCRIFLVLDSSIIIAFFASLHYIVSLRAWALYGKSRGIGILLWGSFVLYLATAYVVTIKGLLTIPASLFPIIDICFGTLPNFLWAIWLPSIVFETLVFVLTLYKAVQHQQSHLNTPILSTLFRDGFLYFLFISANSACNMIFWAIAPPTKVLLIKYLSTAITIAAGSHLILDLREVGHATSQMSEAIGNSRGEPMSPGPNVYGFGSYQLRRLSTTPRLQEYRDREGKIRLTSPISPSLLASPNAWPSPSSRSYEEIHSYPPSPQAYTPSSPTAIRFAEAF